MAPKPKVVEETEEVKESTGKPRGCPKGGWPKKTDGRANNKGCPKGGWPAKVADE